MLKRLAAVAVTIALMVTGLTVVTTTPAAAAGIRCSPIGSGSFDYPGPGASKVYDDRFTLGHRVPDALLDHFVPQGMGTWPDWGGKGKDLVLVAGYNDKKSYSALVGLIPGAGQTAVVRLPKPRLAHGRYGKVHVGGVAVVNGHLFVQGPRKSGHATVQRFSLAALRRRLTTGGTLKPTVTYTLAAGSSAYLAGYRDTLYTGSFSETHRAKMRRYRVAGNGRITRYGKTLVAPPRTQGLVVTDTSYLFSTSLGRNQRSRIWVMRRSETDLDTAYAHGHLACFPAPSMSEGMTRTNGRLYLLFESGSFPYDNVPCRGRKPKPGCTLNIIDNLHVAPLAKLTALA
jgi:hypothetical protein